ncbi:hypothetical protein [Polyangium aurulentum]|uniref:hypothetical protein n=1 Tax=Polyangium aurulentum TaxID=2567896 RepID=UPI00197CD2F4|nr:hypothetical protein [Polyangium aurulentum]UQA57712.1 hypothetical protein E8A73_041595 [Polyangium aurulentum]
MQSLQEQKSFAPRARKNLQAVRQAGLLATLFALAVSLSGCAAVKGIFKAGMWVGILGVIFIVALVAGGASLFRNRQR